HFDVLKFASKFGRQGPNCLIHQRLEVLSLHTSYDVSVFSMYVAEKPDAWDGGTAVILAHGAGQGMDSPFMTFFHREIASRGFLSVKFNFDYMNQKRGVPDAQPKLRSHYRDVIEGVIAEYQPRRIIIGGKSMGGRVASYIAGD